MAGTSKLELIQCVALAVKTALHGKTHTIAHPAIVALSSPKHAIPDHSIVLRPATQADTLILEKRIARIAVDTPRKIASLFEVDAEQMFFEYFNYYQTTETLTFFASAEKKKVIVIPPNTPVTRQMFAVLPTACLQVSKGLKALEGAYAKSAAKLEARQERLGNYKSTGEKSEGQEKLEKEIEDLEAAILANRTAASGMLTGIGIRDRVHPTDLFTPFLVDSMAWNEVVKKYGPYGIYVTDNAKALNTPPALSKVWHVTSLLEKLVPGSRFKEYQFFDQSSAFTMDVKDRALQKILDVFKVSALNPQLLSPVDLFMVRKSKVQDIHHTIRTRILEKTPAELIAAFLSSRTTDPTSYKDILHAYFKNKDLLGISLKLPEKVTGDPIMKVVGAYRGSDTTFLKNQDPFSQFLLLMQEKPSEMDRLIDSLVTIHFDQFVVTPNRRSWEYPVTFKYANIPGMNYAFNLKFTLFTWDKAGFNGQWSKQQAAGAKVPSNWTGGFGMTAANEIFSHYTFYNQTLLPEMIARRVKMFKDVAFLAMREMSYGEFPDVATRIVNRDRSQGPLPAKGGMMNTPQIATAYQEALRAVQNPSIIGRTTKDDSAALIRFFRLVEEKRLRDLEEQKKRMLAEKKNIPKEMQDAIKSLLNEKGGGAHDPVMLYSLYRAKVIESLVKDLDATKATAWRRYIFDFHKLAQTQKGKGQITSTPNIEAHYVAAQFAWFLFHAGKQAHLQIKKKIFLTVYGVITKSGYKIFQHYDDGGKIRVQDLFKAMDTKKLVSFEGAPYVVFT